MLRGRVVVGLRCHKHPLPFGQLRYASSKRQGVLRESPQTKTVRDEDALAQMEQTLLLTQNMPTIDPWTQPIHALDVIIPYKLFSKSTYPSTWSTRSSVFRQNFSNSIKNAMSMALMSSYNSFPDHSLFSRMNNATLWTYIKDFFSYPVRLFSASSTKQDALISGVRRLCLDSYAQAHIALAKKDKEWLHRYTIGEYRSEMERVLKRNSIAGQKGGANTYIWNLHQEKSPCKVVSVRAIEGHYGQLPPANGNRLTIQALVKFETEESLEIYSPSGKPLHTPAPSSSSPSPLLYTSTTLGNGNTNTNTSTKGSANGHGGFKRTPASRTHLTTYLLFEKRMYLETMNWVVRERMYVRAGAEAK
ncbi:hypothetical protein D9758_011821 [Tetrapyrgos nigripes]|uniref:Uncharacterized protein n=1 Tax=Tetrapyrgos nigripes TaxID=182062 RepID=A0A8H5CM99_9AGAR|nr:hypothetical protein D9758_011821 [Tetrapyrgos nigripes]